MITHILKDGKVLSDIRGHVVKMEDAGVIYELMDRRRHVKCGQEMPTVIFSCMKQKKRDG